MGNACDTDSSKNSDININSGRDLLNARQQILNDRQANKNTMFYRMKKSKPIKSHDIKITKLNIDRALRKTLIQYEDKSTYLGDVKNDLPHGKGIFKHSNGDQYEGKFQNGLAQGFGKYYYANGNSYEGYFNNDHKDGSGQEHYNNEEYFEGNFQDNVKTYGKYVFKNGSVYNGVIKNNQKSGNGMMRFYNGDVYKGEWQQDQMWGHGVYSFQDGQQYEGEFEENDIKEKDKTLKSFTEQIQQFFLFNKLLKHQWYFQFKIYQHKFFVQVMQKKQKTNKQKFCIFPDTLSDTNSARIFLSIIIFSSFTLLFNQVTINKEADNFIKKYEIKNVTETPEKFKPLIDDLGLQQEQTDLIDQSQSSSNLIFKQETKINSLEDMIQLQQQFQEYQFELGIVNVLLTYLLIDIISVFAQYITSSLATINLFTNQNSLLINLLISLLIFILQLWFSIYYQIYDIYMVTTRLVIQFVILIYSIFLLINFYQKNSYFYFFGNFHNEFKTICYEYTFQKLYLDYSRNWNNFVGRRIKKIQIKNYIKEQIFVTKERQKIIQKNYLEYSYLKIIKNIFTPFSLSKRRHIIGDFVYYPIKFLSALMISLFIYFYLVFWWIKVANQLKQISDNTEDILRVIIEKFSKDSLKVILTFVNAIYNSFIVTIAIETFAIIFYTIFLLHTFKKEIIKLRKGNKIWKQSVSSFDSVKFLPYYTGNVLIALFVLTTFCVFLFTILLLPYFWQAIFSLILMNKSLLIAFVFNTGIIYIARYFTMSQGLVKRRRLLIFVEFMYFFTGIASTLLKGSIRVLWAFMGNLFNIFRVDKPIVSGRIYALDEAYNVFAGLILMYHQQNNPIVLTFIDILKETQKDKSKFIKDDKLQIKKNRIQKKFFLCVFLARNPSLCQYRKKEKNDRRVCTTYLDFIVAELDPKIPDINYKINFYEEKNLKIPENFQRRQLNDDTKQFQQDNENIPRVTNLVNKCDHYYSFDKDQESIIKIPDKI